MTEQDFFKKKIFLLSHMKILHQQHSSLVQEAKELI